MLIIILPAIHGSGNRGVMYLKDSNFQAWIKFAFRAYYCLAFMFMLAAFPASAADSEKFLSSSSGNDNPVLLQADKLSYDQKSNTITATGSVEIAQGELVLRADKIIYDQNRNVITAKGNIASLQPSGEVLFADEAEITSDMKQGFVDRVKVLFPDNSRLAAQDARRYEGRWLIADRAVYTACNLCADNPEKPPLWQLKGVRVTHDNEAHNVIYRDAFLEMGGIPILFTPYFSHPDPSVKRRQGFLTPSGGYNQYLGAFARVPYYFDIAPNSDAVITPIVSKNDKLQLSTEWRHRFAHGDMKWAGSVTHTDLVNEFGVEEGKQWRGHIFGNTLFDIDKEWRAGTKIAYTSDKSYLQRYGISSDDLLVSRGYVEGFRGRNYAVGNLYYFQDLRPGEQPVEPLVTPDLHLYALGEPGKTLGGRWSLDAGFLNISRDYTSNVSKRGPDTRRLSLGAGWERQFISTTGFLTDLSGFARIDGYWAENVAIPSQFEGPTFKDNFDIRQFAQSDITLRYPVGRHGEGYQQIIEPIGRFTVAPSQSSNQRIPNEDSLDVEFDETNLFASNRFTGIDRLEGGIRAAYGVRHSIIGDNGAQVEMLAGQAIKLKKDENFPEGSGLRDQLSDYVGRLEVSPAEWLTTSYGFRLDRKKLNFQRQEAQVSAGVPIFRPYVNYISVNQTEATTGMANHFEEILGGFSSTFAKYYTVTASHRYAFLPQPGPRSTRVGVAYADECFQIGITGERDTTDRADIKSGTSILFHFYLKNVGGLHTDSVSNANFQQTPALRR